MTLSESIKDFIEFCLLPSQSSKTISFIQLRVNKALKKVDQKNKASDKTDELLRSAVAFREAVRLIQKYKRPLTLSRSREPADPTMTMYLQVLTFSPADILILAASPRYKMDDDAVSIVLKQSTESVRFRREKLLEELKEEGFAQPQLESIRPETIVQNKGEAVYAPQRTLHQRFGALSFPIRFMVETLSVIAALILLMWIVPEIRNAYENAVQKRLNDYLIESALVDAPPPEGTTKEPKQIPTPSAEDVAAEADNAAAAETEAQQTVSRKQPRVNDGETWRFSFTGSQIGEIESKIESTIKKLAGDTTRPLTVPGGIQFDFLLTTSKLIDLKVQLEDMTSEIQRKTGNSKATAIAAANMSWYKKRNMGTRKIPSGNVQVIVWISTL